MVIDGREEMVNRLCLYIESVSDEKIAEIKSSLYLLLNDFEITSRSTELAEIQTDRNEYLMKKFLIAKKVKGCTERTLTYYGKELNFIMREIGKTVDDITTDNIRYYMAIRQRRDNVSKVTIQNEIRVLSSFFGWLYAEEIIKTNPMFRIDKIKTEKTKKEALTEMEVEKIRMAARDEREKMIVEVLLSTGCRVSELVNILISDIDNDKILVHGKGEKDRYVYLNARAKLALEMYMKERRDQNPYLLAGGKAAKEMNKKRLSQNQLMLWWKNPDNVVDGHLEKSSIEAITRKMAERAGVERANPHKFRRTCATMALRRGMPVEQVSKMLGHENIETTQIYLDLTEDELEQAHRKYVV